MQTTVGRCDAVAMELIAKEQLSSPEGSARVVYPLGVSCGGLQVYMLVQVIEQQHIRQSGYALSHCVVLTHTFSFMFV